MTGGLVALARIGLVVVVMVIWLAHTPNACASAGEDDD